MFKANNIIKSSLLLGLLLGFSGCDDKVDVEARIKDYQAIESGGFDNIAISENSNLFIFTYKGSLSGLDVHDEHITVSSLDEDMNYNFLFRIDLNLKCSYIFAKNSWYIKKDDMVKCSKDEAKSEIKHIVLNITDVFIQDKMIKDSWENKE